MKSKTQQAIALVNADKSDLSIRQKCRLAAHKVSLLSGDGVYLAYRHLEATKEHRCIVCGQMSIGG